MCHTLEFADPLERLPTTLDVTDLLLSKLQIVELNEKDLHDAEQAREVHAAGDDAPRSLRWRMRAKVGERKRWYELPEETPHPD